MTASSILLVFLQLLPLNLLENSFHKGEFHSLWMSCRSRISLNLETPLIMKGYVSRDQFLEEFTETFGRYEAEKIEWVSSHVEVEDNLAVESINLQLRDRITNNRIPYKLIFFLISESTAAKPGESEKGKEWKIYYLRGLRI